MKVTVKTVNDLNDQMRDFVNSIQRRILSAVAKDTAETVRTESNGQFRAEQSVSPKQVHHRGTKDVQGSRRKEGSCDREEHTGL